SRSAGSAPARTPWTPPCSLARTSPPDAHPGATRALTGHVAPELPRREAGDPHRADRRDPARPDRRAPLRDRPRSRPVDLLPGPDPPRGPPLREMARHGHGAPRHPDLAGGRHRHRPPVHDALRPLLERRGAARLLLPHRPLAHGAQARATLGA